MNIKVFNLNVTENSQAYFDLLARMFGNKWWPWFMTALLTQFELVKLFAWHNCSDFWLSGTIPLENLVNLDLWKVIHNNTSYLLIRDLLANNVIPTQCKNHRHIMDSYHWLLRCRPTKRTVEFWPTIQIVRWWPGWAVAVLRVNWLWMLYRTRWRIWEWKLLGH